MIDVNTCLYLEYIKDSSLCIIEADDQANNIGNGERKFPRLHTNRQPAHKRCWTFC